MTQPSTIQLLDKATASHSDLFDARHETAFRLFNGFYEGYPDLVVDVYGQTLVIHNYANNPLQNDSDIQEVAAHLQNALSWLRTGILKTRNSSVQ